jgi:Cu(I)/Ag(I) efflux system membrane fusion protein
MLAEHQAIYTCPMHPEIRQAAAGSCPICHMDLVPKARSHDHGGATTGEPDLAALLNPANRSFVGAAPVVTPVLDSRGDTIELSGTLAYDPRLISTVSSRVSGRIERVYVHYAFEPVRKGQRLFDVYSPELQTAQQNLLFLLDQDGGNASLLAAARQRLELLGMHAADVQRLEATRQLKATVGVYSPRAGHLHEQAAPMSPAMPSSMATSPSALAVREGAYVDKGQPVFSIYGTGRLWALLELYAAQSGSIRVGLPVELRPNDRPDVVLKGKIDFIEPVQRAGKPTVAARVYVVNPRGLLQVGALVTGKVALPPAQGWWVPASAVLDLGDRHVVFRKNGSYFEAEILEPGLRIGSRYRLNGMLTASDTLAANAAYLIDSESFIRSTQ